MTGGFTKQINCAAAAYPFIPFTDLVDVALDTGEREFGAAAHSAESKKDALKEAYRLGQGRGKLQRNTAILTKRAKQVEAAAKSLKFLSYAYSAYEGAENFARCEKDE